MRTCTGALHAPSLLIVAGSAALVAAACGLESNGLGGDGGAGLSDGGAIAADGAPIILADANGQSDVTASVESGPAPDSSGETVDSANGGDGCASNVEICNNGIDDNCNGLIDCADPQCQSGWTCTAAAIPAGWTLAEYAGTSRPTCSPGYGSPADVVEGPGGQPTTCMCACNVTTGGSCETGTFSVTTNELMPGGTCGGIPVMSPGSAGACSKAAANYSPQKGAMMQVVPLAYSPGSCTPAPTVTPAPIGMGRVCIEGNTLGAGCANNGVCAPAAAGNGFSLCIVASGTKTCPAGFANAHQIGSSVMTDDRGCTPCTCGGATAQCANPSLTLYTAMDCSAGAAAVPASNMCVAFPLPASGNPTYVAYEYTAAVQAESCPPSAVSPTGGVSLAGVETVCCQ